MINLNTPALHKHIALPTIYNKSISLKYDFNSSRINQFIITESLKDFYRNISGSITNNQCSISITGSYGTGKSHSMLLLSSALSQDEELRQCAEKVIGKRFVSEIRKDLGNLKRYIFPIVGSRVGLQKIICDALLEKNLVAKKIAPNKLLSFLEEYIKNSAEGLLIILDEMGKVLEYSANDTDADIYFFQQLSELACRSDKKLIFIGLLHKSFGNYLDGQSVYTKTDWKKIAGRFHDIKITHPIKDQCKIISGMISQTLPLNIREKIGKDVLYCSEDQSFNDVLVKCYPLHPSTAVILPLYARSGVSQNRRSLSSFVSGFEPFGLRYFIEKAKLGDYYTIDVFWEYINENIVSSLVPSGFFNKWLIASEAINRAEKKSVDLLPIKLAKIIAIHWLFGGAITPASLKNIKKSLQGVRGVTAKKIKDSIDFLVNQSIIVFRKYLSAYIICEGSDFNLEKEIGMKSGIKTFTAYSFKDLKVFNPIFARSHYIRKGTSRYIDLLVRVSSDDYIGNKTKNAFGVAIIDLSNEKDDNKSIYSPEMSFSDCNYIKVIRTVPKNRLDIKKLLIECQKIFDIRSESAMIRKDKIAFNEINSRIMINQRELNNKIELIIEQSEWSDKNGRIHSNNLRVAASELANKIYPECPEIHNEMINTYQLSPVAKRYTKILMNTIHQKSNENNFGYDVSDFNSFPLDKAIYLSVFNTHFKINSKEVIEPRTNEMKDLWKSTIDYLRGKKVMVSLREVADLWHAPPIGLSGGITPFLLWVFYLSNSKNISLYEKGVYKTHVTETDINSLFLLNNYGFFWVIGSKLSGIIFNQLLQYYNMKKSDNLTISRKIVEQIDNLPSWTRNTRILAASAVKLRDCIKKAKDPNSIILKDLPAIYQNCEPNKITEDLDNLNCAQDELLSKYKQDILHRIGCKDWKSLNIRIARLSGNTRFLRFERYLKLLSEDDSSDNLEKIVSLLSNKPIKYWTDPDAVQCSNDLKLFCDMVVVMDTSWGFDNFSENHKQKVSQLKKSIYKLLKDEDVQISLSALSVVNAELREVDLHE